VDVCRDCLPSCLGIKVPLLCPPCLLQLLCSLDWSYLRNYTEDSEWKRRDSMKYVTCPAAPIHHFDIKRGRGKNSPQPGLLINRRFLRRSSAWNGWVRNDICDVDSWVISTGPSALGPPQRLWSYYSGGPHSW
jgi:hypothetical protein